ncbi:glycosyltransferase family 4 protein [Psychroflexus tropicus]|uniref:glycosyltransferase family 4 protein n=1 Tax=Psychroflexus tropicus TaxID=197345 RepID=UPI000381FE30|nr:glycosyltransferase family 4 protein [Psychroflexus tropicus]
MKTISLLHPFSAQAIGLQEEDLHHSHSKAQELALQKIQEKHPNYHISIDYFTGKWLPYQKQVANLEKQFWPVTSPLFRNRHQWRKQESFWHYKHQQKHPAEVTIINMSGHGSPYCFKLARLIKQQGLTYIPMIGGVHMSTHPKAVVYYRNAHHILVHTQVQKEALVAQKVFRDLDIRVLPLGVNQDLFKPALEGKNKSDLFKLIQVGRISRLKQLEHSIHLVKDLKDQQINVQLKLIGFLSDEVYYQELLSLINELNLNQEVQFIGNIVQEKLVQFYQESDLLLMPSQHESFGMVMVEAMACGCPVVGYKGAGGTDEIILHNLNGLLIEPEVLSDSILQLWQNQDVLQRLKVGALATVQRNWSIDKTTQILQNSIRDAIG